MVDFGSVLRRLPTPAGAMGSLDQLPIAREAARPFVPGESVESALAAAADVISAGMSPSILYLPDPAALETATLVSMQVIDGLAADDQSPGADLAVSPVALGLGRTPTGAVRERVEGLCGAARAAGMTVTLTAVAHGLVDDVLEVRAALATEYPDLGVTLTANLHRTEGDCLDLSRGAARVRLLGREAAEKSEVAFTDGHEIDKAFVRCMRLLLDAGAQPILATDDPRLLEIAGALAERADRQPGEYSYQFRHGLMEPRATELVAEGASVSILIPFGPDWAGYVRRWIAPSPSALGRAVGSALGRSAP
jgi:proline dehydrogenase